MSSKTRVHKTINIKKYFIDLFDYINWSYDMFLVKQIHGFKFKLQFNQNWAMNYYVK